MISIFKEKSSYAVFMLFILSIMVHIGFLLNSPVFYSKGDSGLSSYLFNFLPILPGIVLSILYHGIVIVQAVRLNYILQNNKLIHMGYLPAMTYILFTALLPYWNNITPALASNFFIIWLLSLSLKLSGREKNSSVCFEIGFVAGLAFLFYLPLITLSLVMLLGIWVFTPFNFKNFVLYILGLCLPVYFLGSILYLTNSTDIIYAHLPRFGFEIPHYLSAKEMVIALSCVILMVILGTFSINYNQFVIKARHGWTFIFVMLLLAGISIFFIKNYSYETLLVILLPAAAVASNFFYNNKSRIISILLFWILFIAGYYGFIENIFLGKK